MKKVFFLILIWVLLCMKPAFAFLSGYGGFGLGYLNEKKTRNSVEVTSSSALIHLNAGLEFGLGLIKIGAEGFAEKAMGYNAFGVTDPYLYGAKAKFLMNLVAFEPYLTAGIGSMKFGKDNETFLLVGIGGQAKFVNFGLFVEVDYFKYRGSTSGRRLSGIVGIKYYFF